MPPGLVVGYPKYLALTDVLREVTDRLDTSQDRGGVRISRCLFPVQLMFELDQHRYPDHDHVTGKSPQGTRPAIIHLKIEVRPY